MAEFPWDIRPRKSRAPAARGARFNPLDRLPNWLRLALGLKDNEVPSDLRIPGIMPMLDVYQYGWGVAQFINERVQIEDAPVNIIRIVTPIGVTRRALAMSASTSGVTPRDLRVDLIRKVDTTLALATGPTIIETTLGVVAPAITSSVDLLDGHPLIVPPTHDLSASSNDLLLGEVVTLDFTWLEIPAGFAPLA